MVSKKIVSAQHPEVKRWVQLRNESSARAEFQEVLLIGEKLVQEFAEQGLLKALISVEPSTLNAEQSFLVTPEIMKKISGVQAPDGFAAIVRLPQFGHFLHAPRLLLLDRIGDPGNLGSLLRSAFAFGWDGALLLPGTVDPFNDKALRASRGVSLLFPIIQATEADVETLLKNPDRVCWIADTCGTPVSCISSPSSILLVLSNEGSGPSSWLEKLGRKVTIAHKKEMESLGVAAAGAILLHHFGAFT